MFTEEQNETPLISFHQTRLGAITQYIEPISSSSGLDEAKAILQVNPEYNSLPVERYGGVIGLIDREVVFEKCKSPIEVIRSRELETYIHQGGLILDSMLSIDRALSKALERTSEHIDMDFMIYHYGKFLGVGNFVLLLKQADFLRNRDLTEAQSAQEHLVKIGSDVPVGFGVHPFMQMANELGGDFYQTIDFGNGNFLVACFDVSGKGVAAALITCLISSFFSTLKITDIIKTLDPDKIVRMLNELLTSSGQSGKFVVGAMIFVNTPENKLWIYNMALGPIHLFCTGAGGKTLLSTMNPTSAPLGLDDFKDIETKRKILPIRTDTRIFLYTDGLTDARSPNGSSYGEETVKKFLTDRYRTPAKVLMEELSKEIKEFIGSAPQADDITAITIQF